MHTPTPNSCAHWGMRRHNAHQEFVCAGASTDVAWILKDKSGVPLFLKSNHTETEFVSCWACDDIHAQLNRMRISKSCITEVLLILLPWMLCWTCSYFCYLQLFWFCLLLSNGIFSPMENSVTSLPSFLFFFLFFFFFNIYRSSH